jgi:hypothetical protein
MNRPPFFLFTLLPLLLLLFANSRAYAQDKKVLSRTGQVPIGRYVDYLEDKEQKLSIREVVSAEYANQFIRSDKDILNFGFTNSVYWVRFEIDGSYRPVEQEYILEINYPLIDQLTIYRQDEFGAWSEDTEGDRFPFKDREIAHRNIAHKIVVPPRKVSTFYLRFQTEGSMQIPIMIWKSHDFYNQAFNENMIFGILYGTLFVVVAYNIFLFWIVQKWLHLAFAAMIVLSILFLATQNGYAFKYLWSSGTHWTNHALPVSTGLLTCASCIYLIKMLEIEQYSVLMYVSLVTIAVLGVFTAIAPFVTTHNFSIKFGLINGLLAAFISLSSSIICRLKGGMQSRYLIPASYLYLIGIMLVSLKAFGIIETTFISTHGVELGSVCQAVFYSLGLREKYAINVEPEANTTT